MPLPQDFEKQLWSAASQLWAQSPFLPSEYTFLALALIFLKSADSRFELVKKQLEGNPRQRSTTDPANYHAQNVFFVPDEARFRRLLDLPYGADVGNAINEAMRGIEAYNQPLKDVLPRIYQRFDNGSLRDLLRLFSHIPEDVEGDEAGKIFGHFLESFAIHSRGSECSTPASVVGLIVAVLDPRHGRVYDPACGTGSMLVESARCAAEHRGPSGERISLYGIEKNEQNARLCRMNFAVHGLSGDIREGNAFYQDPHEATGWFDFVMMDPPFNQGAVDKARFADERARYPFGVPTADNANYLWIQLAYSALNEKGRAGFVMTTSASDARGSELAIRRSLIESGAVDVIIALDAGFLYTSGLPITLWFLDKGKANGPRRDDVLFVDARSIYRQVDRVRRELTPEQIEFLANITRLCRGEAIETTRGSASWTTRMFPEYAYADVPGLCRIASHREIAAEEWSLSPPRYVGAAEGQRARIDLTGQLGALGEELKESRERSRPFEEKIAHRSDLVLLNKEATVLGDRIERLINMLRDT